MRRLMLLAAAIALSACARSTLTNPPPTETQTVPEATPQRPLASATPEPSPASTPSPVPTATSEIPWLGWPTPQFLDPSTPVPYPLPSADLPDGVRTVAILGSDWLPHRNSAATDTIMLAFVDSREKPYRLSLVSIPRDLYVFVPGFGMSRINSAYALGGEQALRDTLSYNFGVEIERYVVIRLATFVSYIDALGGIDVTVEKSILDSCSGDIELNYLPGEVHMSGRVAQCYARARMGTNDYDRMRRQQEIVIAVLKETLGQMAVDPVGTIPSIWQTYRDGVETDLGVTDIPTVQTILMALRSHYNVDRYVLQPPFLVHWTKPTSGAWLLVPSPALNMASLMLSAVDGSAWDEYQPR